MVKIIINYIFNIEKEIYYVGQKDKYAKGKYIARMDDDDVSISDRLEKERNFRL